MVDMVMNNLARRLIANIRCLMFLALLVHVGLGLPLLRTPKRVVKQGFVD
jgi:hypothetical protein